MPDAQPKMLSPRYFSPNTWTSLYGKSLPIQLGHIVKISTFLWKKYEGVNDQVRNILLHTTNVIPYEEKHFEIERYWMRMSLYSPCPWPDSTEVQFLAEYI